ncbi:hypothetical protein EVAR_55038_1 [Eumeta japonica]|uniref:Uncharacterized protein n=1 Tax=Eumeta variegata TaxID=151549 RepID=A0A4C1ZT50_EUMVA|nr:hypothetical protein EVAR_55038_1 [Eumeta japonica]
MERAAIVGPYPLLACVLSVRNSITVWTSPNDEMPAVAEVGGETGGARRTASRMVPERPSVVERALILPTRWTKWRRKGEGQQGWFISRKIGKLLRSRAGYGWPAFRPIGLGLFG